MDENMSDDEGKREKPFNTPDKKKRLKTEGNYAEESSSSSSNTTQQERVNTTSSGTDSGFNRPTNSRNRNYRARLDSDELMEDRSGEAEDSGMQDEDSEPPEGNLLQLCDELFPEDTDDSDVDDEEYSVLEKEKPKHNWFVIPEVINRQIGFSAKLQSSSLFQRRCYGSLYSVEKLELMDKLEEHEGCVNSINFHPEGKYLASGSDDQKVIIWDWKVGKYLLKYDSKHRVNVFQTKFLNLSGDLHVASCARDGQVRVARISSEGVREYRKLGCHKGPCHKLAILPDQPHVILSAGEDSIVLSHDLRQTKPERIVSVQDDELEVPLYSIHGHPLKTMEFCVSGRDEIVRTYDRRNSSSPLATYHPFKNRALRKRVSECHVTCAVYNHDGSEILASYNDDDIYLFDVNCEPGDSLHQYQGHRNSATIKGVNFFGPRSEFIVSGSDCGFVYFWEKNSECIVQWLLADDRGVVNCLEPHPQLPFICTSGLDWDIKVWVPSREEAPDMTNLALTVKDNIRSRVNLPTSNTNETQMLFMLWRHLRQVNRPRVNVADEPNVFSRSGAPVDDDDDDDNETSSNSVLSSDDHSNDDDIDDPTGCVPS
ncbi:DDB1- and CUL4-associated factor 8 [Leptinotarsa decemlineata]|uniref:DDB1- and CUL4-associated factor 8 n=1 Tax=Leptinotarsa decemlineata TaxID=7539 RepID=UPI000C251E71|nr:DDB1- and CUL4-associated factor 8-like [Leptinotarsa decemlineata]XP_023022197.1 DDB1- and CUL4-associated factor 8-like [Leptinotarsa decemlineata]